MALSRLKATIQTQAVRIFSDREGATRAFRRTLNTCTNEPSTLRILNFYGVGGIGKSHLLLHLRTILNSNASYIKVSTANINLESSHYSSQVDYLLDLRRQLNVDAPLFDYAVARFVNISGRSLADLNRRWLPDDSLLYDFQELAEDLTDVVAPARLMRRLLTQFCDTKQRRFGPLRDEFKKIDELPDSKIASTLPYYLGTAIENQVRKRQRPIAVFIDSLECLSSRNYFRLTKDEPDTWLRELIACAETGVWILAGRNFIKWADDQHEWKEYLRQHAVGPLTKEDAHYFLKFIPIEDTGIRNAIVESAKGVPLYLDLCASTYLIKKEEHRCMTFSDFKCHEKEVIGRFLAHLDDAHREAIRALSSVSSFDESLFSSINKRLNISIPSTLFQDFCRSSYVEAGEAESELYSVHRLIREFVLDNLNNDTKVAVAEVLAQQAVSALDHGRPESAVRLLQDFVNLLPKRETHIQDQAILSFLNAGLRLVDQGRWLAVDEATTELDIPSYTSPTTRAALFFLVGLCARKKGQLDQAIKAYLSATTDAARLGRFSILLEFHLAHTRHLLGDYEMAFHEYEHLARGASCDQIPIGLLARRQRADILMLRGHFCAARNTFDSLIGSMPTDPLWDAETHRFRGHVRRFNFRMDEAEDHYREAQKIAEALRADAMLGKVFTNFAETHCWLRPIEAIDDAEVAIELNRDVGAQIEIGKALSAQAIAYAASGKPARGREAADKAFSYHNKTGYRSGKLFALLALGINCAADNDRPGLEVAFRDISTLSRDLGVYRFLAEPLRLLLLGEDYSLPRNYDWMDDGVLYRMKAALPHHWLQRNG